MHCLLIELGLYAYNCFEVNNFSVLLGLWRSRYSRSVIQTETEKDQEFTSRRQGIHRFKILKSSQFLGRNKKN